MSLLKLISSDSFITLNKELIRAVGLEEAIILGELASELDYWQKNNGLTEDGYFFSTVENVEEKTTLSDYKQRKALNSLQKLGLIELDVRGIPPKRYIKLNEEKIIDLFKNSSSKPLRINSKETKELNLENLKTNNNITNNNIPNNFIVINNNEESSSSTSEIETTQPTKKKRVSRKDQLTEYVESLVIQPETKDIIYKWIFSIGLKGGVTVDKLKDMLNDIWLNSNKDEALVRESINKSYLSNWFGFYPVKQAQTYSEASKPTQKVETPTTPEKSSSTPTVAIKPSPELLAQIGREVRAKFDPTSTY